jgi:dihydrodipicolinate reductase
VVLAHHAESREAFVAGTLAAIRFVRGRAPGLYGMREVLGG